MVQQKQKVKEVAEKPAYKGDGVAVWLNTDKNGKTYLAIKLVGHEVIHAFKNDVKKEAEKESASSTSFTSADKLIDASMTCPKCGELMHEDVYFEDGVEYSCVVCECGWWC